MKYRKKPIEVEAMQLTRMFCDVIVKWIEENYGEVCCFNGGEFAEDSCYIDIKTLEGTVTASEGDWIIKGIENEFYPVKESIFNKTYEKVEG